MDNRELDRALSTAYGEALPERAVDRFHQYARELERFGRSLNLTAIRDPVEVGDKHFADSLAVARIVSDGTLIDVGSGAGFPGVPVAIVRPGVTVTLVDSAKKKVGFLKSLLASLDLPNATALHARVEPGKRLGPFDTAVSRALIEVARWLELAGPLVKPQGVVVAMVARVPPDLEATAARCAMAVRRVHPYSLPLSKDPRALVEFVRR